MKKNIILSLVTGAILFSGCNESVKRDKVINDENKTFIKIDSNKSHLKDGNYSDFDKVQDSASAFGSAIGGYLSKKYNDLSVASKVMYEDIKIYSENQYNSAQKYYDDISGNKEEKELLEKKIKKKEKDIKAKEIRNNKLFKNELSRDNKDNLDFEKKKKEIKKDKSYLEEIKSEYNDMINSFKKSRDEFNQKNKPQKPLKKKPVVQDSL